MIKLRFAKLMQTIRSRRLFRAFLDYRVLAGVEHRGLLARDLATVVDIGANRGQFALAVRTWAPGARVISFEPLPGPSDVFRKVFAGDDQVTLFQSAIGPKTEQTTLHISLRDDSSSLLPITSVQTNEFPGTAEASTCVVHVGPLNEFVRLEDLGQVALLKLDVQGYEYEALIGCQSLLPHFQWIYCECSFLELYAGQKLASRVITLLADQGFFLDDIRNPTYNKAGRCIQADLLFTRSQGCGN